MTELSFAGDFPLPTRADWIRRVEAVLKGAAYEDTLVSRSADGIRIEPVYGQMAGPRAAREEQAPWTLYQRVDHPDPAKANAQALDDLANGATGLVLVAKDGTSADGHGIVAAKLGRVLQGVQLHAVALRVEGDAAMALAGLIANQPLDPERLMVSFGLRDASQVPTLEKQGFLGPFMEADGRLWHENGATEAEELGATLAEAVGFLRQLGSLNDVYLVRAVGVTLAASQDMFITLAKFRAMRLLWNRVLEAAGLPEHPLRLHGETSRRMMAQLDPHTNILRATAAVFGAGLGGADSITVLPFSSTQGLPNAFARRVARNVQTVLMEESHLWRVADPASGAGYIEELTRALCEKAWKIFQSAEAGVWPKPDPASPFSLPQVGTSVHRLAKEYPAEVEALS